MKITPNLNFDGQCSSALQLYQRAFNARIVQCITNKEATWEEPYNVTSETENQIYHAELLIGEQRIMMCDNGDIPFQPTASLSLTVTFDSKEDVLDAYEIMKKGGRIIYPVQSTPYSSCFVSLYDRFGFRWVLMAENPDR